VKILLLLIGFSSLFISCSLSNNSGYWVEEDIVVKDTIFVEQFHEHICDSNGCVCLYIEPWIIPYVDTLHVEYWVPKNSSKQ
jgi:hypothetical protein